MSKTKEEKTMPRGDGTGPNGMGSMTGRGMGYCAGLGRPGFMTPGGGRRFFGRGRMYRSNFFGSPYTCPVPYAYPGSYDQNVDEKKILDDQATFLEEQLQEINKRREELKQKD
jgi:hypothetical protein